ncbi:complement factor H isoform X9 [Oncorhynchus kisutch]|uniref:complement factor H isoform X9 n=1 Tax=Oncorhynchus kisutch TaxID=8019 RepID=UPI0012DCFCBB|nr:complement factor H-like isoform X9 [Oncorhynchus kisutch]
MRLITLGFVFALWLCTLSFVKGQVCFRKDVSAIPEVKNVDISNLEDTAIDKTVRLPCAIGYVGFVRLKCGSKGWSKDGGRKCEPKSCGHPGDTPNGDFHLSILDDFVFGAQVLYQCRKGYQMVTRSRHRTCVEQGWDSALPICEALKCPVIQANDNVVVIGNSEDATYGNVIQFECQSNHMVLKGSSEIDCNDKGEWSSTVPTCEVIKCYAPDIANGAVSGPPKEDYDEDDTLRYSCDTKYVKSQERVPKCTKMVNSANWSPTPACEEVRCKLSFPPTRGTSYTPADRNMFLPDERVTVTCDSGFWNFFSSHTENTITCKEDGKWSSSTTDCEQIEGACINPTVMNGFIVQSNVRNVDPRNSKIYSSCNVGFKPSTGGWWGEATCTEGTWSGILKCIDQSQCGRIPVIPNTREVPHSEVYNNEQTVTIDCKVGYTSETKTIKCKDGEWQTPLPACRPQGVQCDPPPKVENAIVNIPYQNKYREGFEVNYECRKSIEIEGHKKLTCENGSWTTPPPTCKQYCGKPEGTGKQIWIIDKVLKRYKNGNQIDYTCISPYKGPGGKATCKNGEWHMPFECNASCPDPPPITNGDLTKQERDVDGVITEVSYQCNRQFTLSSTGSIRCLNGKWQSPPKCLRSCEISTFAAEYNLQNLPEKNYTAHGEKRTIHCKKGYYHKYKIILPNIEKIEVKCDDGELQYGEHIPICSHRYS